MKYLLLVGHAGIAQGIEAALTMLMGPREYVRACDMADGMGPEEYGCKVSSAIEPMTADDEVIVLADIGGGSPLRCALATLDERGLNRSPVSFGGANLPMAISALMGIEDDLDLDTICDAMLSEGVQGVKQL